MRDRLLIGLSGKAGCGKDTLVQMLERHMVGKARVVRVAFADALKAECRAQWGWDGNKDAAGRTLLQEVGVRRRGEDPEYWIKKAFESINFLEPRTIYVITDCRFLNEADYIRHQGGEVWRINRTNPDGTPFDNGLTSLQKQHPSETDLDTYPFDVLIHNELGIAFLDIEVGSAGLEYARRHSLWFG